MKEQAEKEHGYGAGCRSCQAQGVACMDSIRIFSKLPEDAKRRLAARSIPSFWPKGTVLVHEGDPINAIWIVRKGLIKTFRLDASGEEYVLDILHDGQAIWHGMFTEDLVYRYSVGCLTDVDICRIQRSDFEEFIGRDAAVAMDLIRMLGTELDDAEERAMMLGIRNPRRRLAEYLLHRDARCTKGEIRMKLDDIASSVGLRTETVSRILTGFERAGLLRRLGRGRLQILDHAGLRQVDLDRS